MALRIRIEHGQDAGTTYRLAVPGVYRFGRSPQSSVQVIDMKVSKDHFEILVGALSAVLRDLGSTHGTLLNQQKVAGEAKPINPGDEVRAGLTVLRVLSDGSSDREAKPVGPLPAGEPAAAPAPAAPAGAPAGTAPARAPMPSAGAPDPLVGTSLAGYRLLERVGAGGMGAVYRAEQLSLHREVALKVLSEKLVSDSAFVDQFVNEARAAGQLNHPNVVQVYDVGQADGRHFFSMEFIHGGSIESKIPKTAGVKWQDALNWFLDAANALIFAEKKGILHRDIKPDNFMVGQDGSVKLCDLGLAKKSESSDLLAQGIIGTPHFISPEAIRRKTDVDRRADLYSLGCSFFRIFTGRNPYPAPSVKDILLAHLNAPVPRVSSVVPGFPKDLDDVVFQLMQKDPAQRYQSAEELWKALDRIRLQHGMEAHGLHPGRAKKFAIAGGLVAVAAVGTLIALKPWEKPEPKTIEKTTVIEKPTGTDPAMLRAERASSQFNGLRSEMLEMQAKLGRIEDGDNWKQDAWEQFAKRFDGIASEFDATEGGTKAKAEAQRIRDFRTKAKARADALAGAISGARQALADASTGGVAAAKGAASPLEAEKALEAALGKVREAGKAAHDGQPLVTAEEVEKAEAPLEALRKELAAEVRKAFQTVDTEAKKQVQAGTATALEDAAVLYEAFAKEHPEAPAAGAVAQAWNEARNAATTAARTIRGRQTDARRRDLASDRAAYFAWLTKDAYLPRRDDGSSGDYAAFRFSSAAEKADKAAAQARTAEYRTLLGAEAARARLAGRLPGLLAQGFAAKGFKERLQGNGWNGVPKGFTAEGVQVADRTRLFAEEGLGFFLDLFFEKGQERYPLDADAWEGIGVVAEAATILESAARGDLAAQAYAKAAELDGARKERLAARIEHVKAEQRVRALLDDSEVLVEEANTAMKGFEDRIADTDTKKSAQARTEALAKEGDIRAKLEEARSKLLEAELKHPDTVGRALLGDAPPPAATYAGESPPPAAPAPAEPAMDGAGMATEPGMGPK